MSKKLFRSEEGLAFLEFAICAPFILALLMGSIEVTRYILIAQKVEKTAVTISDVVSQGETISSSDIDNIIFAASQVMQPYSFGNNGYVIISSVTQTGTYSGSNPPIVKWQYLSSGSNGSWVQVSQIGVTGGHATLPNNITLNDKDNVIVAEVFYKYKPIIPTNGVLTDSNIYKVGLYKPRLGDLSTLSMLLPFMRIGGML